MASQEIVNKINEHLSEEFEIDINEIEPSKNLMQTLELYSLDLLDMVVLIEQNFGFTVKAVDFVDIKTFDDFYNFIDKRMNESK